MAHIDLVNELIRQLASRFNPEPVLIKRRIESLIEVGKTPFKVMHSNDSRFQREYLERCEDRKSYNYMVSPPVVVTCL